MTYKAYDHLIQMQWCIITTQVYKNGAVGYTAYPAEKHLLPQVLDEI